MKTLKVLTLSSFFVALFLFVGCNKEEATTSEEARLELNSLLEDRTFLLPNGFSNLKQEEAYLQDLSDEESLKLIENYKVTLFLAEKGLYGKVAKDLKEKEHISDIDMNNYLNADQKVELENFDPSNSLENRNLSCWIETGYCYTRKRCCWYDYGYGNYCWTVWQNGYC